MTNNHSAQLNECSAKFWTVRSLMEVLHKALLQSEIDGGSEVLHSTLVELLLDRIGEGLEELERLEGELYRAATEP